MAKDIQQEITDKLIEALENGVKPWERPWDQTGLAILPTNFKTGNAYSGMNLLLLWLAADKNNYSSEMWLTFKQAKELGGQVRKGEKGTTCIFYKAFTKEDKDTGEEESFRVMRSFTVFNLDQIDGIEMPTVEHETVSMDSRCERADQFIGSAGMHIEYGFNQAAYSPAQNKIWMPALSAFHSEPDFYATLFHEMVHATAHRSRLDRDTSCYAFEELVAEIGAAMLMHHFGIKGDVQHESYVANWLQRLNDDKRFIFKAAAAANKAFEFLKECDPHHEEVSLSDAA